MTRAEMIEVVVESELEEWQRNNLQNESNLPKIVLTGVRGIQDYTNKELREEILELSVYWVKEALVKSRQRRVREMDVRRELEGH